MGVGVDGGVNDVSDERDARAMRLFFNGVTCSNDSFALAGSIPTPPLPPPPAIDSVVSVSSLMACLNQRFLADPPGPPLPGNGAAHAFSSFDWPPSPCGSGEADPAGDFKELKVEGLKNELKIL